MQLKALNAARVDLFLGGDAGLNWGLRLGYESNSTGDNTDSTGFDVGLSGTVAGANLWLNYVMPVTTQVAGVDGTEENADMRLGATYGMGDYTLFGEYYSEGNPEGTDAATGITVGAGRSWETSNGATVFYDVQLQTTTNADNNNATDDSSLKVPVTFGVEVKASSWLTWRASIQQSLYGAKSEGDVDTSGRTTTLGAGASLTWGDLSVDGVFASSNNSPDATRLGSDQGFLTNLSATYRF